jgi:hypothetical protein
MSHAFSSPYVCAAGCGCSQEFRSGPHKALLFSNVVNLELGELHERAMTSGMHTIRTVYWKYVSARAGVRY